MADNPLIAHSLAEAYLYLMATRCLSCEQGPLRTVNSRRAEGEDDLHVVMTVACGRCGEVSELIFALPHGTCTDDDGAASAINPTDEPSQIIDVAQWITLFRAIVESADRETDKQEARRLGIEAAQCIEEAIKFYDDQDNDLPPPEAFFHELSRDRFRANPEQFSRRRLIGLRGKLPTISLMQSRTRQAMREKKRPWWRFGL